jgi:hypothetical protein
VQADVLVLLDLVVETVGAPGGGEEADADRATKVVELQPASAGRIHDRCVVHDAEGNALFDTARDQVRVGRCAKGISHDEERNVCVARRLQQQPLRILLHQLAVRDQNLPAVKRRLPVVSSARG